MFFFAITPADVVLFVNNQYQKLQQARQDRAEEETATTPNCLPRSRRKNPLRT